MEKQQHMPHDSAYRRFFSVPDMLTSLVKDYVNMDFVEDVDFSSLMVRSSAYFAEDLHTQAGDLVWQMKWKGRDAYLLLLLEAQSTPDKYMALRIFNYVGLLWKSLVDQSDAVQKEGLPHVFPIVLYNGSSRWTAARSIAELLEQKSGRSTDDQPTCRYYLIDEGALAQEDIDARPGLASPLFMAERARGPQELDDAVAGFIDRLDDPKYDSLDRSLTEWIMSMLETRIATITPEQRRAVRTLKEVHSMLAENMDRWVQETKAEGWAEGRAERRAEDVIETTRKNLLSFLEAKLGSVPAWLRRLLQESADEDILNQALLTAYHEQDVRDSLPKLRRLLEGSCGQG